MIEWLKNQWMILWLGTRWPYRRKSARLFVIIWSVVLAMALVGVLVNILAGQWLQVLWDGAVGIFDTVMLRRAIQGLLWRRWLDTWLADRRKTGSGSNSFLD